MCKRINRSEWSKMLANSFEPSEWYDRDDEKQEEMKTVCAWCRRHMSGPVDVVRESHGICPQCLREELAKLEPLKTANRTKAVQRRLQGHDVGGEG